MVRSIVIIVISVIICITVYTYIPSLGNGFAHIEGNHGTSFPEGWVWSQSIMVNNEASFSLVLGKFNIIGLTPTNCILYVRRRNEKGSLIFRTTDLDQVRYSIDRSNGCIHLNATSPVRGTRLEMSIRPTESSISQSFHALVHVPTIHGFSNTPGCRETYTAVATIRIFDPSIKHNDDASLMGNSTDNVEEYVFPLTALEYGGSFIRKLY